MDNTKSSIDYLVGLDTIPPFKNRVEHLRHKYGYPKSYTYSNELKFNGIPEISDDFYIKFMQLCNDIIAYLKNNFAFETIDSTIFYGIYGTGIDAWIESKLHVIKPLESMSKQENDIYLWDISKSGKVYKLGWLLYSYAYPKCITGYNNYKYVIRKRNEAREYIHIKENELITKDRELKKMKKKLEKIEKIATLTAQNVTKILEKPAPPSRHGRSKKSKKSCNGRPKKRNSL